MSMQDPIADMLTRMRNAYAMKKAKVVMPSSKIKIAIAKVMQSEGYINGFSVTYVVKAELTVNLKYFENQSVIETLQRISKPSLKVYCDNSNLPSVNAGLGVAIVSTSQGVMSGKSAKNLGLGGEVLCTVY